MKPQLFLVGLQSGKWKPHELQTKILVLERVFKQGYNWGGELTQIDKLLIIARYFNSFLSATLVHTGRK